MRLLSHHHSDPVYHIEDCRIFKFWKPDNPTVPIPSPLDISISRARTRTNFFACARTCKKDVTNFRNISCLLAFASLQWVDKFSERPNFNYMHLYLGDIHTVVDQLMTVLEICFLKKVKVTEKELSFRNDFNPF